MEFNEERTGMISSAIGLAVVNLVAFGVPINRDNLVEELERVRREMGNVIGKVANRDAAEIVRKGQ
ncbi:TPA: hypothetical protein ACWOXG_004608 [Salmonella enterica subsp. enterica]